MQQVVDVLTKGLLRQSFELQVSKLDVIDIFTPTLEKLDLSVDKLEKLRFDS